MKDLDYNNLNDEATKNNFRIIQETIEEIETIIVDLEERIVVLETP